MAASKGRLCLTITAFRRPGLTQEAYHDYMTRVHAPLVSDFMARHGVRGYTQAHSSDASRSLMSHIQDSQFANVSEYDCVIQITFEDIKDFMRLKADPYFMETVAPDHEMFADIARTTMTIGYIEPFVIDGKVLANIAERSNPLNMGTARAD